ncbi:het domain-containing protein [Stemphylium lycopersici]|uniref:HET-domain-containing protein n=1 Tax=Stemphylium lycopersici TaxID=183478 RepID=A0A364MW20_STELY|nr:het domain-containing protein [Stemphylium lycopersici]RAR05055.1 HET-domain-containing protein [Stemphylium lycopersici]
MPPPTHLCEKCRRLNLPYHVQREHDTAIRDLGYISGEIIDKNCSQCVQFSNILRRSSSQANTTSGSEAFSLQVKHLQLDGYSSTLLAPANRDLERDSRRYLAPVHAPPHSWVAYFGLTGQRSGRTLHLLPRQVYFIDSRSEKHSYSPFCRKLNENFADYEFLRDHLELCQSEHSNTCPTSIQDGRWLPARLIDCESRLLCPAQDKQYACLSYVWGDVPADRASSDKVFGVGIPQTVADAMVVTPELGIRYLWVDRYCIDQSNAAEKHKTIRNMDSIYRNASVTIVAAAGSDSSYGLPGVSRPRKVSRSCKIGGRTFIAVNDPAQDMRAAVWSTRGWTYQEMMLSRRLIFFTDCQIYFQCREQLVMEQLEKEWADRTTRGDFQAINPMTWLPYAHGSVYQAYDLIIEYYGRTLRYRADSINAFAGMFRDLAERTQRLAPRPSTFLSAPDLQQLCLPRENPHFYGIPVVKSIYRPCDEAKISSEFGLSLAWAVKGSQDENPLAHNQSTADHDFPSWTWASRKAQRSEHDPGELTYLGDATLKNEDPKMELSMSVTHRSGQRMNMVEYVSQTADYTFFHPW